MYTILVSVLIGALSGGLWTAFELWKTWQMGILLGVIVALLAFILISRATAKKIEPQFAAIQKQIQANQIPLAMQSLEDLMPQSKWQVLLKGQIHAQIGMLAYASGDDDRAGEHLEKAGLRSSEARLTLAALQHRQGHAEEARQTLELAIRASKKQIMPYHVSAWMAVKDGDRETAIKKLLDCQKVEPSNETTKENLQRLQNGKKLSMKRFGMQWFGLKLENPPAEYRAAQGMAARKGFRQKPKRSR